MQLQFFAKPVDFADGRYVTIASTEKLPLYSANEMMMFVKKLDQQRILEIRTNSKTQKIELVLIPELDELAYSLKDEVCFSKHSLNK